MNEPLGIIYIAYAPYDERRGLHMSKIGYQRPDTDSDVKEARLNRKILYRRRGRWRAAYGFADADSWDFRFKMSGTYDEEQAIHDYIEERHPDLCGHVRELYHARPSDLFRLIEEYFGVEAMAERVLRPLFGP